MNKEQTYKELAKILLKRLIILERDAINLQKELEKNKHIINILVEANDIIPYLEVIELLETDDSIFKDIDEMTNNYGKNLDQKIEKFFNKYITKR